VYALRRLRESLPDASRPEHKAKPPRMYKVRRLQKSLPDKRHHDIVRRRPFSSEALRVREQQQHKITHWRVWRLL
jgi:uncharacterized membrane protein YccC